MSLFSKKPAFLMAALGAAGINAEQVDAAFAANDVNFLAEEGDTRATLAADLSTKERLLETREATIKGHVAREAAMSAALAAFGITAEQLLTEGADPAAIAQSTLKTAAAREAADTLAKHGVKPIAGASAPAGGANTMSAAEFAALDHAARNAFMRGGGKISDNN